MFCTRGDCHYNYEFIKHDFMTASAPYEKNMVIVEGWDRYHKSGVKWMAPRDWCSVIEPSDGVRSL